MKKEYYYGILPLALTSCLVSQTSAQERQINRPNVVFIYADDIGYGDLSCNGAKTIHTPNVERLAKMGVRFTNAHSAAATSTPSRYAMLTGEYAWRKEGTGIADGDAASIIRPERYTMADMFKEAGYSTGVVGKWHLGLGDKGGEQDWNKPLKPGTNDIGFDYSFIMAATGDRVPCVFVENDRVINLDPNDPIQVSYKKNFPGEPTGKDNPELLKMHPSHGHNQSIVNGISRIGYMKGGQSARWIDEDMADYFVGQVKGFLQENKDKPFFLYYGLHEPHVPRAPHKRFVGTSGMGPRGDAIIEADWCVGQLVSELRRLNLLDNTIIIFSSDNGPVLNDGYKDNAAELVGDHKPAGGLRGGKYSLYDGGTHIPLLVYWKNRVTPVVSNALVSQMDLFASIGKLIDANVPEGLDSKQLLSSFLGEDLNGRQDYIIENQGKLALRSGDYVFMPAYDGPKTNLTGNELGNLGENGLFNLTKDPSQLNNLASDNKELTDSLEKVFLDRTMGFYRPFVEEVTLK